MISEIRVSSSFNVKNGSRDFQNDPKRVQNGSEDLQNDRKRTKMGTRASKMTPKHSKMRSEGPLGPPWGKLGASRRSKVDFCTILVSIWGGKWGPKLTKNHSKFDPVFETIFYNVSGAKSFQKVTELGGFFDQKTSSKRT